MTRKKQNIKSFEKPLPPAGDSARRQVNESFDNWFESWGIYAVCFVAIAGGSWICWLLSVTIFEYAVAMTIAAAFFIAMSYPTAKRAAKRAKAFRQGQQGERFVASKLGELQKDGYQSIHDLPGDPDAKSKDQWNIDHVMVGPTGVFVIETKNWNHLESGHRVTVVDGQIVDSNGRAIPNSYQKAIGQAEAAARTISEILYQKSGKRIAVRPVLALVNWYVLENEQSVRSKNGIWIMNPRRIEYYAKRQPMRLSNGEVNRLANDLRQYVRDAMPEFSI